MTTAIILLTSLATAALAAWLDGKDQAAQDRSFRAALEQLRKQYRETQPWKTANAAATPPSNTPKSTHPSPTKNGFGCAPATTSQATATAPAKTCKANES